MIKSIYAIYDEEVKGVPNDIFTDWNDGTVIRGLNEQTKKQPISKSIADKLILVCLGQFNYQNDLTNTVIDANNRVVGRFSDFLSFSDSPLN